MHIRWLERAEADLSEAIEYLLLRNPAAAIHVYDEIRTQVALLAEQPGRGRPGRVPGTRELVVNRTPYLVPYTVDLKANCLIVLRVLHGARRWLEELP